MGGGGRTQVSRATASETLSLHPCWRERHPGWLAVVPSPALHLRREGGRASLSSALSGEQGLSLVKLNLQRAKRLTVPRRSLQIYLPVFRLLQGCHQLCLTCPESVLSPVVTGGAAPLSPQCVNYS